MIGAIILQVVLIFLNAIFASAEIAVISFNDAKLKKLASEGNGKAKKLVKLTEQPAKFLATIQVAITLASLLGSAYAADNFAGPLVEALLKAGVPVSADTLNSVSVLLITLILAYFSLVCGELVPKRIAMSKAEQMALGMAGILYFVSKAFKPIVWFLTASTNFVLRLFRIDPNENNEVVTEEEIRMLILEGNQQGTIREEESKLIENVFEFNDTEVDEICTHKREVDMLDADEDLAEWDRIISNTRHTYYPVCDLTRDDVIGILDTKDYFRICNRTKDVVMAQAVDKPFLIQNTMKADALFRKMKEERKYVAVVLDEYGTMSGIITLHDLIETLVGDIHDEEDEITVAIEKLEDNCWKIQGFAELEEVAKELDINLPTDTYDTYSGFICGIIGYVPEDGTELECTYDCLNIKVKNIENHIVTETITKKA